MSESESRCNYLADGSCVLGGGRWCCWRPVWKDHDRCFWHADEIAKSLSQRSSLPTDAKRCDGAILCRATNDNSISLSEYTFIGADFANASLEGVDLSNTVLVGADFTEADLEGADLSGANLRTADLSGANLRDVNLSRANLCDTDLEGANLTNADLTEVKGRYANFRGCSLRKTTLSNAKLPHSMFGSEATLRDATGDDVNFRRADFSGTDLFNVEFTNVNMSRASLSGADLEQSRLEASNLEGASLTDAVLFNADLSQSDLFNADMTTANAQYTTFVGTDMEDVMLDRTDLRDADLTAARLYQAVFSDARINRDTQFGETCIYESDPTSTVRTTEKTIDRFTAAIWTYRRLERLHNENAIATKARKYHIRKNEAQRGRHYRQQEWSQYLVSTANRYLTHHGESLKHIILVSIAGIVVAGLLYPLMGGIVDGDTSYQLFNDPTSINQTTTTLFRTMYFSVITFTTIGYGNVYPVGIGSRVLVGIESLFGALMMALFVYVLGRRVAR